MQNNGSVKQIINIPPGCVREFFHSIFDLIFGNASYKNRMKFDPNSYMNQFFLLLFSKKIFLHI